MDGAEPAGVLRQRADLEDRFRAFPARSLSEEAKVGLLAGDPVAR